MNGFTYSIQTETVSRRRESRSRGICLSKVCIKRGMELSVNPVSKNCYGAADSYKLSFPVLPQVSTSFPAIDLYRNVAVQKRIRQALNRLEELKSLPENWDENGALSIERRAYENTKCALEIIGEKASEAWNLFPNTNGTLLLTAPGKQLASINIGNENFSFFAMGKDKKVVKGMREFSPENLTNAFDQIQAEIGRV